MPKPHGITIRDVARRAEVSITAVSHALNDKGTLSQATREKVRRIAEEMGYEADALARGLRRSKVGVIGLVVRPLDALDTYSPSGVDYFLRYAGAAATRALDLGMGLMQVADLTKRPITPLAFSLDGYIVMDPLLDDPVVKLLQSRNMPFVTLNRDMSNPEATNWVASDDQEATQRSLVHLEAQGARTIAFVAGTDQNSWNHDGIAAYQAWCTAHGQPSRLLRIPEMDGELGGREAARQLLADGLPGGVHCMTGRHAAGLQAELSAHGKRTPQDLLLAAGSDAEQTRAASPPITSLDLHPEEQARATVDLLNAIIREQAPTEGILRRSELIIRGSTNPHASSA